MSQFLTSLCLLDIDDNAAQGRGLWVVEKPLVYHSSAARKTFRVESGFKTDLASVPRLPFIFDYLGDIASKAAALHDGLYSAPHQCSRRMADRVLMEAAIVTGTPGLKAWMLWVGVRLFGANHWE